MLEEYGLKYAVKYGNETEEQQHNSYSTLMLYEVADMIRDAPAVDAEPVRHGRWEHLGGDEWCCTVCGEVIHTEGSWEKPTRKYCHECGAKMGGGTT